MKAISFVFLLVVTFFGATIAKAQAFLETFDGNPQGWSIYQYDPAKFQSESFDGDSRLVLGVSLVDRLTHDDQWIRGKQHPVSISDSAFSASIDVYIPSAGLPIPDAFPRPYSWGIGMVISGSSHTLTLEGRYLYGYEPDDPIHIPGFIPEILPSWRYQIDGGAWQYIPIDTLAPVQGWNTMKIRADGSYYEFGVGNTNLASGLLDGPMDVVSVALFSESFGYYPSGFVDSSVYGHVFYMDNLAVQPTASFAPQPGVPEPSTYAVWISAAALLFAGILRRRCSGVV